jgi:uncharacterized protein
MSARKALGIAAILLTALYAGYLSLLYIWQDEILFPGTKNQVAAEPPHAQGAEVLKISTATGNVEAIFLSATVLTSSARQPLVIFGHGNGEVIDYWLTALNGFRDRGIGVLLVEYPGYGRSTGSPSEESIRIAMDSAYDRIATDSRVDRTRIFGFGQSLGGGAICLLAKDRPLRAMILQSTFSSLDIFAAGYWAPAFLLHSHFNNISTVSQFAGPILVIHGRQDRLIPLEEGRRLAAASPKSVFKIYDCGHGCWDPDRLAFWHDAGVLLESAGILPTGPPK